MKVFRKSFLTLLLAVVMLFGSSLTVFASDLDALVGAPVSEETTTTETPSTGVGSVDLTGESDKSGTDALIDAISGQETFTGESMEKAQKLAAPVITLFNIISSFLIIVLLAGIGVITVLDLIFIGIPFVRQYMYPMYNQQIQGGAMQGGMMSPMGGGYGGFGRSYGMGGMGMMSGIQGGAQQPQMQRTSHQWVSDEAIQCIGLAQPMQQQQPMGMMGGMQQQPQQPLQGRSVIVAYLKRRTVFIVIFTFSAVFLTSSILTGFGLKLFSFAQDLIAKFL